MEKIFHKKRQNPVEIFAVFIGASVFSTFVAIGYMSAANAILTAFSYAVLIQFLFVIRVVFSTGWLFVIAYIFHAIFIGVAGLSVGMGWTDVPAYLPYGELAGPALIAQYALGMCAIRSREIAPQYEISRSALLPAVAICSVAALVKYYYYYEAVGSLGGYLSIYTEGDTIRDASPAIVRLLAAAAPLVGLLAITQKGVPYWARGLGLFAIALEVIIGIRSRPVFLIACAFVLIQHSMKLGVRQRIMVMVGVPLAAAFVAFIGYARESWDVSAIDYLIVTSSSLFSSFDAAVLGSDQTRRRGRIG
ncbi:hypothetical protein [Sphingomonas cavernae]|uniref:Uncharacterized protein n=1 Tax=Sphingomonas cavernae TaxID=2320861 RepID=A0A418WLK6_9SPHN|nr:hypothetical protein [Sphingomonas cavernae]RJF90880.1 hypothetical protein D3876_11920 [Sphingomonas cavernae]